MPHHISSQPLWVPGYGQCLLSTVHSSLSGHCGAIAKGADECLQRCGTSPWCAAAGGSCLCLSLLEIPWHRGGCVSLVEAEVGDQGDQGGLWLPPHLVLLGKFLGGLTISLHHPYLWFSAHFRSFLFKAHHLKSNSFLGSPGRSPLPFMHKG